MTKLTDTQRTILAAAGARETHLVLPLTKSLKLTADKARPILTKLLKAGLLSERAATEGEPTWRRDDSSGVLTLVITDAGLTAVGIELREPGKGMEAPAKTAGKSGTKTASRKASLASQPSGKAPAPSTKLGTLIALLRNKKGATIEDLTTATGWQAHSIRGAISGALKKKLQLNVVSMPVDGRGRVYRIAD